MADQKTKRKWGCPDCPKTFKTELSAATHIGKEHIKPVDDSFYDDKSWTMSLIP
jgi:protein-arginine kinase activator protein McsA